MNNSSYTTQNDLLLKNLQHFYNTEIDGCYDPNNNLDKMMIYFIKNNIIYINFVFFYKIIKYNLFFLFYIIKF